MGYCKIVFQRHKKKFKKALFVNCISKGIIKVCKNPVKDGG
jgi:hypothetical protein